MNLAEMQPRALALDPGFPELKEHVIATTGLAYYLNKDVDLAEKVGKRLVALNIPACSAYLTLLRDGHRGESELDELVRDLTIGETYFFRHREQFDALRQTVLPDILRRNASRRQIRIWSAGCASGAEVYSISILLHREFGNALAGWDVSILGTDINRTFLAQAREGQFGDWALRSTDEAIKSSYFERHAGRWRIGDPYREGVSFQYHNLVKHPYPSLVHNLAAFDLILCRNVMIYFSRDVIGNCVDRFWNSLVEGGWLLVGHAEVNQESFRAFRTVTVPGTVLFERAGEALPAQRVENATVALAQAAPWQPPTLPDLPPLLGRPPPVPENGESGGMGGHPLTTKIRQLADRAEWKAAAQLCLKMIDEDALNPLGHFYHALVLEQTGQMRAAESALSRAIYLDREFVLAHYHRGLLLQRGQDVAAAARSFRNVMNLLRRMDSDKRFAEADGIAAAELMELAQMQLDVLEGT